MAHQDTQPIDAPFVDDPESIICAANAAKRKAAASASCAALRARVRSGQQFNQLS
ncbi:hypothetical protein PCASD_09409 [Puccinia coronata f. sp. avenae]|uniref:Uncharacterized protein n=1 Tax=Puccinia coronata f. sp. avenae TaxID=200324 RepID=A0A2N5UHW4_9BASI|nr:hypothetical protein PCASD_09409 [Puccinia coronata f. sp. avenae]